MVKMSSSNLDYATGFPQLVRQVRRECTIGYKQLLISEFGSRFFINANRDPVFDLNDWGQLLDAIGDVYEIVPTTKMARKYLPTLAELPDLKRLLHEHMDNDGARLLLIRCLYQPEKLSFLQVVTLMEMVEDRVVAFGLAKEYLPLVEMSNTEWEDVGFGVCLWALLRQIFDDHDKLQLVRLILALTDANIVRGRIAEAQFHAIEVLFEAPMAKTKLKELLGPRLSRSAWTFDKDFNLKVAQWVALLHISVSDVGRLGIISSWENRDLQWDGFGGKKKLTEYELLKFLKAFTGPMGKAKAIRAMDARGMIETPVSRDLLLSVIDQAAPDASVQKGCLKWIVGDKQKIPMRDLECLLDHFPTPSDRMDVLRSIMKQLEVPPEGERPTFGRCLGNIAFAMNSNHFAFQAVSEVLDGLGRRYISEIEHKFILSQLLDADNKEEYVNGFNMLLTPLTKMLASRTQVITSEGQRSTKPSHSSSSSSGASSSLATGAFMNRFSKPGTMGSVSIRVDSGIPEGSTVRPDGSIRTPHGGTITGCAASFAKIQRGNETTFINPVLTGYSSGAQVIRVDGTATISNPFKPAPSAVCQNSFESNNEDDNDDDDDLEMQVAKQKSLLEQKERELESERVRAEQLRSMMEQQAKMSTMLSVVPVASVVPSSVAMVDVEDDNECRVCQELPMAMLNTSCGHQCVCESCSINLLECPICRSPVERWIRVYKS